MTTECLTDPSNPTARIVAVAGDRRDAYGAIMATRRAFASRQVDGNHVRFLRVDSEHDLRGLAGPVELVVMPGAVRPGPDELARILSTVRRINAIGNHPTITSIRSMFAPSQPATPRPGDAQLDELIRQLNAIKLAGPVERVHLLGALGQTDGSARSARTQLADVRALAAYEVSQRIRIVESDTSDREQIAAQLGMVPATAYKLIARGRDLINADA